MSIHGTQQKRGSKTRKWLINIGLMTISTTLMLAIVEVALRLVAPHELYTSLVPNTQLARPQKALDIFPGIDSVSHFSVNEYGYRSPSYFDKNRFGILTIGGSTTQCISVSDHESWPWLLEDQLNASESSIDFTVGNIGAAAFNSGNHYHQLKHIAPQFDNVKMVLMLVGVNDFARVLFLNTEYYPTSEDSHLYNRSFVRLPRSGKPRWYQRNEIFMHLRDVYNATRSNQTTFDLEKLHTLFTKYESATKTNDLPDMSAALHDYENNLRRIAKAARGQKLQLVLITQPTLWHEGMSPFEEKIASIGAPVINGQAFSPSALSEGMSVFNERLRQVAQDEAIPVIDLATQLPKDTTVFYDWCHYNKGGSAIVADLIFQDLKPILNNVQPVGQLITKDGRP